MEIANKVDAKVEVDVGHVPIPSKVRNSTLPDPESTRQKVGDKTQFRQGVENTMSEAKVEEVKSEEVMLGEEQVFSKADEPEIRGTIVITLYRNHPYEVELSGDITGSERDLAIRALMKGYAQWKAAIAKKQEQEAKAAEAVEARAKEEADAGN